MDKEREVFFENKRQPMDKIMRAKIHDFLIPILSMSIPAGI